MTVTIIPFGYGDLSGGIAGGWLDLSGRGKCNCSKSEYDRIVAEIPTDGFLYPTLRDVGRCQPCFIFCQQAEKVNISMVEEVLGCTFTVTAQEEKATFQSMMETVVGGTELYSHYRCQ